MDTEDPVAPPPDEPTDDTVTPQKLGTYLISATIRGDGNLVAPPISEVENAVEQALAGYFGVGEVSVRASAQRTDI